MKHLLGFSLTCGIALCPALANAQQTQLDTEALLAIGTFAEQFCGEYLTEGSSQSVTVSGEAEAELKGLLNRLADLGVSGAATMDSEQYVGVLREEARGAMQDARDCKLVLWESLSKAVVQPRVTEAPKEPARTEPVGYIVVIEGGPVRELSDLGTGVSVCGTRKMLEQLRAHPALARFHLQPLGAGELHGALETGACDAVLVQQLDSVNQLFPLGLSGMQPIEVPG